MSRQALFRRAFSLVAVSLATGVWFVPGGLGDQVTQINPPAEGGGHISYAFTFGPDGKIYLGTIGGNDRAKLLVWDPANPERGIIDLGEPTDTETYIWEVTVGKDGRIYGCTYPQAKLVVCDPATGEIADLGRMDPAEKYNRHVAVGTNGWIYNGIGVNRGQIVAYNPATGEKRGIVREQDRPKAYTGDVYEGADGHAYGSLAGKCYRLVDGQGMEINKEQMPERRRTPLADGRVLTEAQITDSVHQRCGYKLVEPHSGQAFEGEFGFKGAGIGVFVLGEGPDNVVYGSTILPMEIFTYDPATEQLTYHGHLGSGELYSIINRHGTVYGLSYPGAAVWQIDATKPWSPGTAPDSNPRMLRKKYAVGVGHLRPRAAILGPDDMVYIGSSAGYGTSGGAVAVWNPEANAIVKNYREHFENSGVACLAYDPASGLVFGGSNGIFIIDPEHEKVLEHVDMPTPVAMCVVAGRLYCVAETELRVFDIERGEVVHTGPLPAKAVPISLSFHTDGFIYGLSSTAIYGVDPSSFEVRTVAQLPVSARCGWVVNDTGIYFGAGTHVWRYRLADAEFEDLGEAAVTANLYGAIVGPDADGQNTMLYFLFKTGKGFFLVQVKPEQAPVSPKNSVQPGG